MHELDPLEYLINPLNEVCFEKIYDNFIYYSIHQYCNCPIWIFRFYLDEIDGKELLSMEPVEKYVEWIKKAYELGWIYESPQTYVQREYDL
jgi:hypothetical protein